MMPSHFQTVLRWVQGRSGDEANGGKGHPGRTRWATETHNPGRPALGPSAAREIGNFSLKN